ncbi:MAG: hypothetical protein F6K11_21115 [Leptolyngbya sp. SIO3F4]|nr:hypothetical protein [Leptolyngbya sp. SIO3F4]
MEKDAAAMCDRVWLMYLQGRLSPAQLLALCKLSANNRDNKRNPQSSAA